MEPTQYRADTADSRIVTSQKAALSTDSVGTTLFSHNPIKIAMDYNDSIINNFGQQHRKLSSLAVNQIVSQLIQIIKSADIIEKTNKYNSLKNSNRASTHLMEYFKHQIKGDLRKFFASMELKFQNEASVAYLSELFAIPLVLIEKALEKTLNGIINDTRYYSRGTNLENLIIYLHILHSFENFSYFGNRPSRYEDFLLTKQVVSTIKDHSREMNELLKSCASNATNKIFQRIVNISDDIDESPFPNSIVFKINSTNPDEYTIGKIKALTELSLKKLVVKLCSTAGSYENRQELALLIIGICGICGKYLDNEDQTVPITELVTIFVENNRVNPNSLSDSEGKEIVLFQNSNNLMKSLRHLKIQDIDYEDEHLCWPIKQYFVNLESFEFDFNSSFHWYKSSYLKLHSEQFRKSINPHKYSESYEVKPTCNITSLYICIDEYTDLQEISQTHPNLRYIQFDTRDEFYKLQDIDYENLFQNIIHLDITNAIMDQMHYFGNAFNRRIRSVKLCMLFLKSFDFLKYYDNVENLIFYDCRLIGESTMFNSSSSRFVNCLKFEHQNEAQICKILEKIKPANVEFLNCNISKKNIVNILNLIPKVNFIKIGKNCFTYDSINSYLSSDNENNYIFDDDDDDLSYENFFDYSEDDNDEN